MATCNHCELPAVANYQRVWVRWNVQKDGSYKDATYPTKEGGAYRLNDIDEPTEENNIHVCATHEEKLLDGEI